MTAGTIEQVRRIVTELPGPRSRALAERRKAAVSHAVSVGMEVYIDRAEGAILVDVDGNHLIDLGSGIAVASVGHADPRVVAAVTEQVARFTHTCFMVTPYPGYVELCEKLAELTPGTHEKRSALFNSGAEAVENAVKIARAHTGRTAVIAFDHAYHGRTNLTMALTAKVMPYKAGFGPFAPEIYRVPMAYPYRWPTGPGELRGRGVRGVHLAGARPGGGGERRSRPRGADPGRGRLHRPCPRVPRPGGAVVHRQRHRVHRGRDPDRLLPYRRLVRLRARGRSCPT